MFSNTNSLFRDQALEAPSDIGFGAFNRNNKGPYEKTFFTVDHLQPILINQDVYNKIKATYEDKKNTFDSKKKTYEDKFQKEKDRLADPIKAAFDKPVDVPQRPCEPTRPLPFYGMKLKMAGGTETELKALGNNEGFFRFKSASAAYSYAPDKKAANKAGYIIPATDAVAANAKFEGSGHVFGRLG